MGDLKICGPDSDRRARHPALTHDPRMSLTLRSLSLSTAAVLACSAALASQAGTVVRPDAAKGQQLSAACQACHVVDGSRGLPANPLLVGQHPEYLVKQLSEFKGGRRKNAVMTGMAAPLSDEDMRHIAAFYGSRKPVTGTMADRSQLALGEAIYRGGILAKGVPACAGCHSPNGAGMPAQYPRLGGQHAPYTELQLNAFRSGERANSAQMTAIAARLSDREIKAVADYMAGLR